MSQKHVSLKAPTLGPHKQQEKADVPHSNYPFCHLLEIKLGEKKNQTISFCVGKLPCVVQQKA